METSRNLTIKQRAISILLSIVMVIASIPSALMSAFAGGPFGSGFGFGFIPGGFGPNVLTNVSVSFYDSTFKPITEVDSGQNFYLSVQLAGNNVNDPMGTDHFRLEITDNNLLLPNFADDGFKDGAVYNGFTLHVDGDNRYLEYDIKNGDTKMIRLQAKFANGKTPDNMSETVKLIQTTTNRSVSNTITANSALNWSQSKGEDKQSLNADDLAKEKGVNVNYTLSATSNNAGKKTAAWWAKEIHFKDSITGVPEGVTATVSEAELEAAIKAAGFTDYDIISTTPDNIEFIVYSNDTDKEMDNVKVTFPVNYQGNPTGDNIKITNTVEVTAKGIGSETEVTVGSSEVSLEVPAPPTPPSDTPMFRITKSVDKTSFTETADVEFTEEVEYKITVENYGTADGEITIVEDPGNGITLGDGQFDEKTLNLKVGEKETFTINATISGKVAQWENKTFTNHVYDKKTGNGAYASTSVSTKQTKVGVSKTGYVGDDKNNTWFTGDGEEKVTYEITFNNWGDEDETVTYKDILNPIDAIEWDEKSKELLSGTVTVPARKTETITLKGTIKAGDVDKIENKVESSVGNAASTLNRSKAIVGVTKEVENGVTTFNPGDTVKWHIKVSNSGNIDSKDVVIWDEKLANLDGWEITVTATNGGKEVDNPPTVAQLISDDGFTIESIAGNTTYDITISAKSPEDAKGKISNTASWKYDGKEQDTNTVTVEPKQYDAEKWIVDEKGKTLVESDGTVVEGFDGFTDGNKVTFRTKFTNNSNQTYKDLYMNDWCILSDLVTPEIKEINIKVVETTGDVGYTKGDVLSLPLRFNDQNAYSSWQVKLEDVNSTPSSSFTLEYTLEINATGQNDYRWTDGCNYVGFDEFGYNVQHDAGLAFTQVKIPRATSLSYSKETDTDSVDINNEEKFDNGVLANGIDYTITFTPNQNDQNDYTNHTFTITDTLPKGMTYKAGSIKSEKINAWEDKTGFEIVGNPDFDPVTSTLTITLKSNTNLTNNTYDYSISYTALISDELAEKIKATPSKKPYELTNTVNKVEISGDKVNKTIEQEATAKTTFTNSGPAPGFAKAGIASIPGGYDEDGEFNRAEHGFITAGDALVWDLVIYNGDGSANYNKSNTGEFNISGMKITDILPNVYEYGGIIGAGKVKLNNDGKYQTSAKETGTLAELNQFVDGSNFEYGGYVVVENADSPKPVFTVPDVTLEANEAYVIRIYTTIKDGMETEGVITNRGFLTTKEEYTQSEVTAGEPKGKEIWNSANYNIVGLTTESWKTISYTGKGHTIDSDGHNDPIDDTGFSRDATHNYVQGVQGEEVKYELHIINTSPIQLEQWTIIDRLPYIGDIGLVSGYERSSAFNVMMGEIESVEVAGEKITDYKVYYSSDKTTVLNEYSEDWLDGKSGEMQWYDKPRKDSVNFRITIPEQYKVGNNKEIVITFTGTVPNYVEKTGESNIAWNSFAYGYKSPNVLGDTVMVAEPAKVGVWVETPETTFDITINKEVDGTPDTIDRTFYFAIFDKNKITEDATRLSDVFEVVVSKGETTGTTVLENIDRKALGVNQANQIYILETDKDGKALKGYTTEYTNNAISADMTDTEQTITVKNTKQVGSIEVTKKVAKANESVELTADNFFFALFTVDEATNTFVRYTDAPVKKAAYDTTSESIKVTFDNIPAGENFYVLETDSKGILADNKAVKDGDSYKLPDKFTSTSGNVYNVTYSTKNPVTVENGKDSKIEITNTKAQKYEIIVDKSLVMENVSKVSGKFKVELVEYDVEKDADGKITSITEKTATEKNIKEVTPGTPVKFENLKEGYYRVYELYEANGKLNRITSDEIQKSHKFTLSGMDGSKKEYELRTSYDGAGDADNKVIELNSNQSKVSVGITNTNKNPNKITVNKTALLESTSGAVDVVSGHEFNVALFKLKTKSSGDNEKAIEFEDAKNPENYTMVAGPFTNATGEDGKCSIQIDKLKDGENLPTGTYYVFEIVEKDGEITPLLSGSTLTVNDIVILLKNKTLRIAKNIMNSII